MFKKALAIVLGVVLFFSAAFLIEAQEKVNIHLFGRDSCPHCAEEKEFLARFISDSSDVEVVYYEIENNRENRLLLQRVAGEFDIKISAVPFTVVGEEYLPGYADDETSGEAIKLMVNQAREENQRDVVGDLISDEGSEIDSGSTVNDGKRDASDIPDSLKIPLLGKVSIKSLSLPVLTFVVALLDGFNPCAMWVLMFLISLLLGMKDRRRMWILGSAFILASGAVYFLFLSAWLNLFLFLGFVFWVRVLVGLFALGAGGYYLYDWWINKSGECKVTEGEKRQRVFERLKEITQKKSFLFALVGIVLLAIAVNLIELVCSAGLPAVYTSVLSMTPLPVWQYYLYLLFYILIFMLDDLFVFVVAMTTLRAVGIQTKYARYSHLIGGVIMLFIGIALLFRPELLSFR